MIYHDLVIVNQWPTTDNTIAVDKERSLISVNGDCIGRVIPVLCVVMSGTISS